MKEKNIEFIGTGGGLKCDNPNCDWSDASIEFKDMAKWLNKPCPICGENLLTEEDYKNAQALFAAINILNEMSSEEIDDIASVIDIEELKKSNILKNTKGIENLGQEKVIVSFSTHKTIEIKEITPLNTDFKLVIIESPFAGDVETNVAYARKCAKDCLNRGEAPFASHLLYTQAGILNDEIPEERELGIKAGLVWGAKAEKTVVYTDLGISIGMKLGIAHAQACGREIEYRKLY